jgi:general secretion pathway protein G
MNKNKKAFTLIELIVVLAVISILAGFLFTAGQASRRKAKETRAEAMIASLETAVSIYYADNGDYPSEGASAADNTSLKNALTTNALMEFDTGDIGAGGNIVDPWGNPYNYDVAPVSGNTASYNLWSYGPDGTSGNADDIKNW